MGPDDDRLPEEPCYCVATECRGCPGDDQREEGYCSGCGHAKDASQKEEEQGELPQPLATLPGGIRAVAAPGISWRDMMWGADQRQASTQFNYTWRPAAAPPPQEVTVQQRQQAVDTAQRALRTNRGIGVTEPGLVEEIIRLSEYILRGNTNSVDRALRD